MSFIATAAVGLGTAAYSSYSQINAAESMADSYEWKAYSARVAGERAVFEAKLNNTRLLADFNQTQANQVLTGAIQGRSGQTLANIARVDAENLAWDQEFMMLNGMITKAGHDMDAAGYEIAAAETIKGGYEKASMGMLGAVTSFAKVT